MSASSDIPTVTLTDRSWRRRHSAWLLAPILGLGAFSFIGFVYCAVRIRERKWVVLAGVSGLLSVAGWFLVSAWTDANGNTSNAATAYVLGLWVTSVVFAFVVNPDYLAWRASSRQAVPLGIPPAQGRFSTAPAGWYPDPEQPQLNRYWDGQGWTNHTSARFR
jgi:hypothetical protein